MAASALSAVLPKPKYTGEEEAIPEHAKQRGTRVVGPGGLDDRLVVKRSGPPPYGSRSGWRPRSADDFGDGGAFPEVAVAQYPLDMGREKSTSSNALALQVNEEGKVDYNALARRGHSDKRIVHAEFKDLIPLRQRADAGDISLDKPSEEDVEATRKKTQDALTKLIDGAVAAQKPKNVVAGTKRGDATYVSYTPDNQMGNRTAGRTRLIKIVDRQLDPMEPPKHKHKKIPRGPPSPPPPVMHSPPRKLTAEDQENWKIPAAVSNWKNAKGYTIPIDKRMASDGRGLQDVTINDKFAQFAEALQTADHHAREEVKQRSLMQQRLAEKEKEQKEENLRQLARKAREDREAAQSGRRRSYSRSRSPSRSISPYSERSRSRSFSSRGSRSPDRSDDDGARRERERMRRERREENERKLRQSRMGTERRIQQMAREQNRDISEKIALGAAKPTKSAETMYDSRLFNQTSAFHTGFNEDQPYDKPLFQAQDAINAIYRPSVTNDDDETADDVIKGIQKGSRFEELGKAGRGFKGAEAGREAGPVQFEREKDPFGINEMEKASSGKKRYGLDDREEEKGRSNKRARVEDED